jgi:hypothetical protein
VWPQRMARRAAAMRPFEHGQPARGHAAWRAQWSVEGGGVSSKRQETRPGRAWRPGMVLPTPLARSGCLGRGGSRKAAAGQSKAAVARFPRRTRLPG